jgi:SAM-dependent methyltransferase
VRGRQALLTRLGLPDSTQAQLRRFLDASLPALEAVALDAGCGRSSPLASFRPRIRELVGVDLHQPEPPLPWLDRFERADLCRDAGAFAPATFDLALSSFTVEHLADPPQAFRILHGWLRPGGWLVISTVNRDHPFVAAYLSLPARFRDRLQRLVKASGADAHPLVGRCNQPARLRRALEAAGFGRVELVTTGHLARAWSRRWPTFLLGLVGDLAAQPSPGRRSTIVARAQRMAA